jgi:hypothetical protein
MGFMAYYLRRARQARDRAEIEPYDAQRRAWIEVAEIIEARCLLFLSVERDPLLPGQELSLLFLTQEPDQHIH